MHKIEGEIFNVFEYKGMKTVEITDYTHITHCKHTKCGEDVIMLKFNISTNIINYYKMCTK